MSSRWQQSQTHSYSEYVSKSSYLLKELLDFFGKYAYSLTSES